MAWRTASSVSPPKSVRRPLIKMPAALPNSESVSRLSDELAEHHLVAEFLGHLPQEEERSDVDGALVASSGPVDRGPADHGVAANGEAARV
jgi:hypothetical protein